MILADYRLDRLLDEGDDAARAFAARHRRSGVRVAVRAIRVARVEQREALQRALLPLSRLEHPNLARVVDVFTQKEHVLVVTEWISGTSLHEWLRGGRKLDAKTVVALAERVCDGLEFLHAAGLHFHALLPSRILIDDRVGAPAHGGEPSVRLSAWNACAAIGDLAASQDRRTNGSVRGVERSAVDWMETSFLPPERRRGEPPSASSDVFALGVSLYTTLAGRLPFVGRDAYELDRRILRGSMPPLPVEVPALLRDVVERCLRPFPQDRFADARELREHLRHVNPRSTAQFPIGPIDLPSAAPARVKPPRVFTPTRIAVLLLVGLVIGALIST